LLAICVTVLPTSDHISTLKANINGSIVLHCAALQDSFILHAVAVCGLQTAILSCAIVIATLLTCPQTQTTLMYYITVITVAVCFSLPVLAVFFHCDFVTWLANYIVSSSTKVQYSTLHMMLCNVRSRAADPLPSNRQHLSYDGCLEVRGEIIITVPCCIVC